MYAIGQSESGTPPPLKGRYAALATAFWKLDTRPDARALVLPARPLPSTTRRRALRSASSSAGTDRRRASNARRFLVCLHAQAPVRHNAIKTAYSDALGRRPDGAEKSLFRSGESCKRENNACR